MNYEAYKKDLKTNNDYDLIHEDPDHGLFQMTDETGFYLLSVERPTESMGDYQIEDLDVTEIAIGKTDARILIEKLQKYLLVE